MTAPRRRSPQRRPPAAPPSSLLTFRPLSRRPLMFKRILIANRGEIALRIIRACREMGIETVAIYSEGDRGAQYLELADEAYCVGPPKSAQSTCSRAVHLSGSARRYRCPALSAIPTVTELPGGPAVWLCIVTTGRERSVLPASVRGLRARERDGGPGRRCSSGLLEGARSRRPGLSCSR